VHPAFEVTTRAIEFQHNAAKNSLHLSMTSKPADLLDSRIVAAALGEWSSRFPVEVLERCDSTSDVLLERMALNPPSGSVVVCENQTAGRGRRGRSWLSSPGDSLTFSLLWRFPAGMPPPVGLSLAVGVAAARALEDMGAAGIALKWPNDILADGAKLGGILIETVSVAGRHSAVIGIGLNVRLPDEIAAAVEVRAGALAGVMPHAPSRNLLLANLLKALSIVLNGFEREGFAAFADEWQARHAYAGQLVRILADGADCVEGRCAGVDRDGALLLETATGVRRIVSGDVSLRTP
jgi:BirA family transcriptional regulator, biotin operon repressor / biotin---[acetyl-CoA-carboxylase] ligase